MATKRPEASISKNAAIGTTDDALRVLVVEDNVGFAYFLNDLLGRQDQPTFDVEAVTSLAEALQRLAARRPDVILLDLGLPDSKRYATFERVRECNTGAAIIILTVLNDDELAMKAMGQGAQDYLVKDEVDQAVLLRAIRYAHERTRKEAELRHLSGRLLALQDEERRRIARELHDGTAQGLAALAMNLSALQQLVPDTAGTPAHLIDDSLSLVRESSRELRTLSYLLHPPLLDEVGLASAVREFADGFSQRSGIRVDLELPDSLTRLPRDVETAMFRVMQECLTNVHKHSGSTQASVTIDQTPAGISLAVSDRGRGMSPNGLQELRVEPAKPGVGIPGMRERMQELGGTLHIESSAAGTTVTALLPLEDADHGK